MLLNNSGLKVLIKLSHGIKLAIIRTKHKKTSLWSTSDSAYTNLELTKTLLLRISAAIVNLPFCTQPKMMHKLNPQYSACFS